MARSGKGKKKGIKDTAKTQATSAKEKPAVKTQPVIANEKINGQEAKNTKHKACRKSGDRRASRAGRAVNNASIADRIVSFARSGISIYTIIVTILMGFMFYLRAVPTHDAVFTNWPWIDGTNYVNVASDDGVYPHEAAL